MTTSALPAARSGASARAGRPVSWSSGARPGGRRGGPRPTWGASP
jgi:hypothetical protein